MKAHTNAKKNFTKVFEKNGWRPMRRADAVYDYQQLVGGLAEDLTLKVFDDLVKEGFIRRRGGWYELALCPCAAPKLAEPPKLVAPTPEDLEALRALIAAKFPRDGQSNPFHFCIVAGVNPEPGRVSDVRYAFREAVKDGLLEKLADGEEYRWCGPVEPPAPAPAPRPATPPPPDLPACVSYESAAEFERLVLATLSKNADDDEHPASSFHHYGPRERPDWTVESVEAVLRRLSERPEGYAPVRRCADPACGWYTVRPLLPLVPQPFAGARQSIGQTQAAQLIDLAQKGRESLALSEAACDVLEGAAVTISTLLNVEVRLKNTPPPVPEPATERAGCTLNGIDSEALCREVVWRLAQGRIPGPCASAIVTAFTGGGRCS